MSSTDNANLFARIARSCRTYAAEEALAPVEGPALTYGDLDREASRFAGMLRGLELAPGDRVSVQVEKSPEALCLYLGCLRAGMVYHPLNTGYRREELRFFLSDAEPGLVVCDPADGELLETLAGETGVARVLTLGADGEGSLMEAVGEAAEETAIVERGWDELAALLYSSGTTGRPKGVMLTHGNLVSNAETLVAAWGFSDQDRLLHALPIFHVHGLFVAAGCALLSGASMRWLARFSSTEAVRYLPECTVMMGVPTYYTRLLADLDFTAETARHMRLFVSGSAPLLPETFRQFELRTGHRILERYGMTETNMNSSNPLDGERRPGTVGPPLPGVEARVVDDAGAPVEAGVPGNLEIRGPNVFRGYWRLPEKTAEAFTEDGFLRTGDNATVDADGYLSIVGRSKDLIISGGLNVYPKEVEIVMDGLAGVLESAVIGAPHADLGEAVVAVVVAEEGARLEEASLIGAVKEQVAGFKVPKRVVFVDELPRNTMAKVQKGVLRERFGDLFSA